MADHAPVEADPQQILRAQEMWHNVAQVSKWGILAIVVLLAGLALIFIDFS